MKFIYLGGKVCSCIPISTFIRKNFGLFVKIFKWDNSFLLHNRDTLYFSKVPSHDYSIWNHLPMYCLIVHKFIMVFLFSASCIWRCKAIGCGHGPHGHHDPPHRRHVIHFSSIIQNHYPKGVVMTQTTIFLF
ncbi:hypothetical protein Hanom_Chr04g00335041 [Helianthus anomalus]